ncbi:MAG: holo-ACP synthase [Oscillospiraceae bacterium]|nr:holo-ACP synthase [Oscillospiraceae bacterium]
MFRIGTDIVEVKRIEKSAQRESFLRRVYSQAESALFSDKVNGYESMAGNWAAKEAFAKSLGTGVEDFGLSEVEVLRDKLGAPYIRLSGNAKRIADEMGLDFSVSISHTSELAIATVIAFPKEDK